MRATIQSIRTAGLGDTTYLILYEGRGILVDPQRDVDRFLEPAAAAGVELRWVLETHVHNDYLSGAAEAAARTGADLVLPAGSGAAYAHVPAFHGEELRDGTVAVRPLHTPGHTPEHCSYLLLVDGDPIAVFTGGSLLVGAAGRTDLLGDFRARQLARLQHGSLHRLAALPDEVGVYPTHGEGSFCTSGGAGRAASTIGEERRTNRVLSFPDPESFADDQLAGLMPYPRYYAHMAPLNLRPPAPLPDPGVPDIAAADLAALRGAAAVVDIRPREAFAAGHVPGSLGIPLEDSFASWTGWLLPFGSPIVLVADPGQDTDEAAVQLARIGFDDVRGVLRGVAAWTRNGGELDAFRRVTVDDVAKAVQTGSPQVLDVRAPDEWESERIPGSVHRYLPGLLGGVPEALRPDQPVIIGCASGHRSAIAAGLLEREGYEPVVLDGGGVPDVVDALPPDARA